VFVNIFELARRAKAITQKLFLDLKMFYCCQDGGKGTYISCQADWMNRMEMIEEKMEQREKKERKNNVIITGIGAISGNVERGVEEWLEREIGVKVNVKEAFKINKDKMMLAKKKKKIENWEQKKNIMLSKSKLKEKKG
jgi:hypothetical protein